MIWAILALYFMVGFFIGYRTHRLNVLLKTKKMERNAMILSGLYNDCAIEIEKLKLANDLMKSHLKAIGYEPDEMLKAIIGEKV